MKIAFATQDKERVDAHFGWAKSIVVYDVSPEGHRFIESFDFGDKLEEDGDEDKLAPKLDAIKDCRHSLRGRHRWLRRGARGGHEDPSHQGTAT